MGEKTGIKWTDHTFNSHMGCQRVSPACGGAKGVGGDRAVRSRPLRVQ
jgi:protein gp37